MLFAVVFSSLGLGPRTRAGEILVPQPGASWQYQLSGTLDLEVEADVFDIDGFETTPAQVAESHASGRYTICYVSAGAWEPWRPDASDFPQRLLGRSNSWPGERWLDIRRLHALKPVLRARLDMCERKRLRRGRVRQRRRVRQPLGVRGAELDAARI
jgi:hypothetical protein